MSCLYILKINPLPTVSFAIIFSHSEGFLFNLLIASFAVQKLLSLIKSHLFTFVFISIILRDGSWGILVWFMSLCVLPMFSSNSFTVSGLKFRSLTHFELISVYSVRKCSNFTLLHVTVQFSHHHLLKWLFALLYILASFVKNKLSIGEWVSFWLYMLFHWSIFLFLFQYHTVLMTVALV